MPVKFQGRSEYDRKYKWLDSMKSATYAPGIQAAAPYAGATSSQLGAAMEPPLQRKKRPVDIQKTNPIGFNDTDSVADDGYMLLGSQDKFTNNIKYRTKSQERPRSKKTKSAQNGKAKRAESPPPAPRLAKTAPPPPPPRPVFDTGAPKGIKARMPTPQLSDLQPAGRPTRSQEPKQSRSRKDKHQNGHQNGVVKSAPAPKKKEMVPVRKEVKKSKGDMNEFVQTDLDKGVADSGQEAPANYALKYKTGIAPPRSRGPKRMSEYALQFTWKKGMSSSPLIDAEQIVYKNNPAVPPQSAAPIPKSSEYRANFKPWQLIKSTPNLAEQFADDQVSEITPAKIVKKKRSRSVEDISALPAAGVEPIVPEEDKRLVKESMNPQKLHFPHGKLRRQRSEYDKNYKAPAAFSYQKGAWYGPAAAAEEEAAVRPATSWFQEVLELRRRAGEYKRRAQGTHFSRSHVGQLFAEQADLWDTVSNSEVLDALDLESGAGSRQSQRSSRGTGDGSVTERTATYSSARYGSARSSARASGAVSITSEDGFNDESDDEEPIEPKKNSLVVRTEHGQGDRPRKGDKVKTVKKQKVDRLERTREMAVQTPSPGRESVSTTARTASTATIVAEEEELDDEGRVPTPKLKPSASNRRHHLDRTTPMVGGAILTSPPKGQQPADSVSEDSYVPIAGQTQVLQQQQLVASQPRKSKGSRRGSDMSSSVASAVPLGKSVSAPVVNGAKASRAAANATPLFGMPTRDSHLLMDDDASTDRPLATQYVHSPSKTGKGKTGVNVPSTINEGLGETYNKQANNSNNWQVDLGDVPRGSAVADDDVLSMSARSLASSCSLASEVLERAKNRRDEFWRKP